ncbi:OB-fold-containig protein [Methylomarinum vadi]|uniref:OB-fold-containig protein n=1 Tax=Methylomarinum vadi TaxID=438855 RepID=UPI0004DF90A4|nr:OB-fold-containig protein [Methylomarinum vadi]
MDSVLEHIVSFPTVVYTVPLTVCLIFWIVGIIGLFDPDFLDVDIDADTGFPGLLATFGLAGVPITLSLSLLFFFAWALCLSGVTWLLPLLPIGFILQLAGIAVLLLSFVLAVIITGKITRPLSRLFVTHEARSNRSLLGQSCVVTSQTVSEDFGQARVEDGGASLVISVRSDGEDMLKHGDKALIYDYEAEQNVYYISKLDQ